jgi:hypothetical protein
MKANRKRAKPWCPAALGLLVLVLLLALPHVAVAQSSQGDSWDFPLDTRGADSGISVTQSDSSDFILDTTGPDTSLGGVMQSDSADFALDTTGPDTGAAGVLQADSSDFTLDTRGADTGSAGVLQADSADFTLDTTGPDTGVTGVLQADSSDFILDTRGSDTGGGISLADSPDFLLDTLDWLDIGLRVYDGLAALKIAVEAPGAGGQTVSALRVNKGGTNYGILLIPTNWPDASRIRIQTTTDTKAWRKLP